MAFSVHDQTIGVLAEQLCLAKLFRTLIIVLYHRFLFSQLIYDDIYQLRMRIRYFGFAAVRGLPMVILFIDYLLFLTTFKIM